MTGLLAAFARSVPKPDGRSSLTLAALKTGLARLPRWMAALPETRFAGCRPGLATLLLMLTLGLLVSTFMLAFRPDSGAMVAAASPMQSDAALYIRVAERVASGENYYVAAVAEHRARGYPLRPFQTVRLPTLAFIQAVIGQIAAAGLLAALSVVAAWLMARRLAAEPASRPVAALVSVLACLGLAQGLFPLCAVWHEAWAAVFIVLSFAVRSSERWSMSVVLGIVAVCFRELALPYLGAMAFMALVEGRRVEAAAWLTGIAAFAAMLGAHAWMLSGLVLPSDEVSPGWLAMNGWPFVLSMLDHCSIFGVLPIPLASLTALLALVGWIAWPGPLGARGALLMSGYVCTFLVVGRQENVYWGFLWAPLLLPGLALAPAAIRDLVRAPQARMPRPLCTIET